MNINPNLRVTKNWQKAISNWTCPGYYSKEAEASKKTEEDMADIEEEEVQIAGDQALHYILDWSKFQRGHRWLCGYRARKISKTSKKGGIAYSVNFYRNKEDDKLTIIRSCLPPINKENKVAPDILRLHITLSEAVAYYVTDKKHTIIETNNLEECPEFQSLLAVMLL
jgi:hypothetical protein